MVKVGWRAHRRDPANQCLQWPYLTPCLPLPISFFLEEVEIQYQAQDAKHKSHNCF